MSVSKLVRRYGLSETLKMFYPPKGDARAYPVGVQLFILIHYLGQETYLRKKGRRSMVILKVPYSFPNPNNG